MINPFKAVNWNPGPAERRRFAASLIVGFPCLALVFLLIHRLTSGTWTWQPSLWLGGVGLSIGVLLRALPGIARPFYLAWHFIACCVGMVVSNVLLGLVFYVVVTGIGLALRACGRQPVRKRFDKAASSYWIEAERVSDMRRYYRQF
jgi:hypothetical protein